MIRLLRTFCFWVIPTVIGLTLTSGCGNAKKDSNLYSTLPPVNNQTVIPGLNPDFGAVPVTPINTTGVPTITAVPSLTAAAGNTIYLVANYNGQTSFNFQFQSQVTGVSFSGASSGVQQVGVTSSQAANVTVVASPTSNPSLTATITLTFTGAAVTPTPSAMACSLYYSSINYFSQSTGPAGFFTIQSNRGDQLQITNAWTSDSREQANYYTQWDNFTVQFLSAGTRTIYARAISLNTRATCEAQLQFQVNLPNPAPTPSGSCGLRGYTGAGYCTQALVYSYYFDGSQCRQNLGMNGCEPRGPFQSLSECKTAVSSGRCGGTSPATFPLRVTAAIDSRSTSWVDTGVDVFQPSHLSITATGEVRYGSGSSAFSGPNGRALGVTACKTAGATSFNNIALIGKIGANGTPFIVGSDYRASSTSAGRLYLIVNDSNCASDNSGYFLVNIEQIPLFYSY